MNRWYRIKFIFLDNPGRLSDRYLYRVNCGTPSRFITTYNPLFALIMDKPTCDEVWEEYVVPYLRREAGRIRNRWRPVIEEYDRHDQEDAGHRH